MNKIYKPLQIKKILPEELEIEIDKYIEYLNSNDRNSEDCYQTEINVALNWCRREHLLPDNLISTLKDYYVFGGIHKGETNGQNL